MALTLGQPDSAMGAHPVRKANRSLSLSDPMRAPFDIAALGPTRPQSMLHFAGIILRTKSEEK